MSFKIQKKFLQLYNNSFDDVDIWVGGILETVDRPGELFREIISDQFQRIRNGDRFWYKNLNNGYVITYHYIIYTIYYIFYTFTIN